MVGAQAVEDIHAKFASELFQQFEEAYDTKNQEKLRVRDPLPTLFSSLRGESNLDYPCRSTTAF